MASEINTSLPLPDILFPNQQGYIPKLKHPAGYTIPAMRSDKPVLYTLQPTDFPDGKLPTPGVELKDLIIRLAIPPASGQEGEDQFILTSTDGSYSTSKTLKDDLILGDDYLDLRYVDLDTSKSYTLKHKLADRIFVYFENIHYTALESA